MGKKIINLTPDLSPEDLVLIEEVKKFIGESDSFYGDINKRIEEDFNFYSDDAYSQKDKDNRGNDRNQASFNIIRRDVFQIVNNYKDNKFGISLSSKKQEKIKKAELTKSIIEGIESDSRADDVYGLGIENSVICGYGYIVITTDYSKEDNESFDQSIKIIGVQNPVCVKFGNSEKIDGSDVNEAALVEYIDSDLAEDLYGKDITNDNEFSLNALSIKKPENTTMMVTYYKKRFQSEVLYKLKDGRTGSAKDFSKSELIGSIKKTIKKPFIEVSKVIGHKVISQTELPIKYIPIVPIYGTRIKRNNKWQYLGIVDSIKDCQRYLNYAGSLGIERVAHSIRPIIAADYRGIGEHEEDWRNINKSLSPVLFFDGIDKEGQPVAAPTVLNQVINNTDVQGIQTNMEDLMSSITGIPKAGLGVGSAPETAETATAILTKSRSSDKSYSHFYTNLASSIEQTGRIILELLNVIYDTPRDMTLVTKEGKSIKNMDLSKEDIIPDELEVTVEAGPMSPNERKESLKSLLAITSLLGPESLNRVADKLFLNSDIPGSEELAERFKYIDTTSNGTSGQDPAAVQALNIAQQTLQSKDSVIKLMEEQLNQTYQMITQLQSALQANQVKVDADMAIANLNNQNKIELKRMEIEAENIQLAAKIQSDAEKESQKAMIELQKHQDQTSLKIMEAQQSVPEDFIPTPHLRGIAKGGLI